jgi:TolB protein
MMQTTFIRNSLIVLLAIGCAGRMTAAERLVVSDFSSNPSKLVPVSLEGYSGEVLSALRFDLEVAGFKVTSAGEALLLVSGSNNPNVTGMVRDGNRAVLMNPKEYSGGTVRLQAHTFADDIVALLGRQGIARTKIAFKSDQGQNSEIYVADYDGHNAIQVTQDHTLTRDPSWVWGRRALYYTSYKAGNPDIYVHDLQNGARRAFARYAGLNAGAAPSPDGRRVAMVLSKGGSPDIYVCDADGANLKQLTRTKEAESAPCWSPDGRWICYSSRELGRSALFVISADGNSKRRLRTDGAINCTEPDWSPDGKTIVFTALMGSFQICTAPANGGSATPLVAGEDPSWAPNSRTVIFTRNRVRGKGIVSLLDVPTKQTKDIQQTSGSCSQPCWAK